MIGVPGTRSSALRAGCGAQMPRCVLVLSSVPSPMSARLRADAREGRDGTITRTVTKGHRRNGDGGQ